jgi:hypothetical protein
MPTPKSNSTLIPLLTTKEPHRQLDRKVELVLHHDREVRAADPQLEEGRLLGALALLPDDRDPKVGQAADPQLEGGRLLETLALRLDDQEAKAGQAVDPQLPKLEGGRLPGMLALQPEGQGPLPVLRVLLQSQEHDRGAKAGQVGHLLECPAKLEGNNLHEMRALGLRDRGIKGRAGHQLEGGRLQRPDAREPKAGQAADPQLEGGRLIGTLVLRPDDREHKAGQEADLQLEGGRLPGILLRPDDREHKAGQEVDPQLEGGRPPGTLVLRADDREHKVGQEADHQLEGGRLPGTLALRPDDRGLQAEQLVLPAL